MTGRREPKPALRRLPRPTPATAAPVEEVVAKLRVAEPELRAQTPERSEKALVALRVLYADFLTAGGLDSLADRRSPRQTRKAA